jgi:hypothetical protein
MWLNRWTWRKPRAPKPEFWLSRQDAARVEALHAANCATVLRKIFVKDNGASSWISADYSNNHFHLSLLRRFNNLPRDWEEVTDLALQLSGLGEEQCANVRRAVATGAVPGGYYTLSITPEGYCFKDCVGNFLSVVVAEGTF